MDTQEFSQSRYEDQANWYDAKASENQKTYKRFQWTTIVLSAITPVLIGIEIDLFGGDILRRLAMLTSVIVAILTSAQKTFRYQENWINYRTTSETLQKEIHLYRVGIGEYGAVSDKEALFVSRVESIISTENTMWVARQKSESDQEQTEDKSNPNAI